MSIHIADVQIPDTPGAPILVDFGLHALTAAIIERRFVKRLPDLDWKNASGVYVLLTTDASGNVYVGKSDNLKKRMADHNANPPLNWSTALLIKRVNDPGFAFSTADIAHLENRLHAEVSAMAGLTLVKVQVPQGGSMTPARRQVLDQLVPAMLAALRLAGVDTRQRTPVLVAASTGPAPSTPPTSTGGTPPRAIRTNYSKSIPDLLSQGLLTPGTPIVLVKAGAVVANATIDASGKVQMNGVAYDNPSAPATAVLGRAANGYKEWQVGGPTGKRLKDL